MDNPQVPGRSRYRKISQRHLVHMLPVTESEIIFLIDTCVYGHQQGKAAVFLPHQPEGMLQQFFRQVFPPVGRICSYAHNIGDPLLLSPQQNAVRIQVQHVLQVPVLFGKAPKDQVMLQTVFFKIPPVKRFLFFFKAVVPEPHDLGQFRQRYKFTVHIFLEFTELPPADLPWHSF